MSFYGVQVTIIFILTFINTEAKKPPGYVAPQKEYDPNPPKYEYGYRIQEEKATHGKDERRDGIYAQGRYYVEKGAESSHNVKYFADDWGYHPVVEYSNKGPHSKSSTNFALGEEAIKLKNNQKSIPQDPSDPGKAQNLAKLDPASQEFAPQQHIIQSDPSTYQPSGNQPQLLVEQPQQVVVENQSENPTVLLPQQAQPQIVVEQDPPYNQPSLLLQQPEAQIQVTPTPNTQHEILVSSRPIADQPEASDNAPPQLIKIEDPQTIILQSTPQPEILLQKEVSNQPDTSDLINDPTLVDVNHQQQEVLIGQPSETRNQPQPVFYYVQPQQGQFNLNIPTYGEGNQLNGQSLQPQIHFQPTAQENGLVFPFQQYSPLYQHQQIVHPNVVLQSSPQNEQSEGLPQPQALIYPDNNQHILVENLQNFPTGPFNQNQQIFINNEIADVKEDGGHTLETAALTKIPNKIVGGSSRYLEFGAKLNPKTYTQGSSKNLIESTKNLVSGIDVLNINAAISHSSNGEIETSSLHSLLNQYVTPTIVNNHVNVDVNHFEVVSSTTIAPPVTSVESSLFREPIVVAESPEDSEHKPVIENTDENEAYFSSTSRSSLVTSTTSSPINVEGVSEQILVTPRPVSSKFLAPITAGVQLQHIEEPLFEDTKSVETHEAYQSKNNVVVQVQKTVPYYLGMYEYPLAYASQYSGHNMTGREKAIEDIELGKTLLYFPGEDFAKSDSPAPLYDVKQAEQSPGIPEINSNYLTVQQLPSKHVKQNFVEIDRQALQGEQFLVQKALPEQQAFEQVIGTESKVEQQYYVQSGPVPTEVTKVVHQPYPVPYPVVQKVPYPVEKIVDRPVHIPIQVTNYVDRPYPIEVPYPQPYPVEKIVKEPYAVPVQVQVPIQIEKVVKEPYAVPVHVQVPVEKIVEKPVEKIIERNVPVPYYVDRVVEKQVPHYINRPYPVGIPVQNQAYLLQIPGLFTQQKYSTLVRNTYPPPQKLQIQYSVNGNHHQHKDQYQLPNQGVNPYSYASQINQYLPPKQDLQLHRGQKLKKLNLLVFPRVNIPLNLPPVTKNPYDLQQSQSYQSFRHSNAQLDNGYLPPSSSQHSDCVHSDNVQAAASHANSFNAKHPEGHVGLIPPKRPNFDDTRKYRTARSHFDDKSIRLEYGFMPPLIPSLEIDEQGQPIERDDNKN